MTKQTAPKGMTLVEILFAFAVIGTVVTVAYSAALRAWRTAVSANQRTQAQYLAQDQLERARAYRSLSVTNDPTLTQTSMDWNGFLNQLHGPTGMHLATSTSLGLIWDVNNGPIGLRVPGDDATNYTVALRSEGVYCSNGARSAAPAGCGGPQNVTSVDLQAVVTWTAATGVTDNRLIATTQLLAPSE
ncbi:hypothetical protein IT415_00325 [bacterium]|nr:hypothetical protein [bacterium]